MNSSTPHPHWSVADPARANIAATRARLARVSQLNAPSGQAGTSRLPSLSYAAVCFLHGGAALTVVTVGGSVILHGVADQQLNLHHPDNELLQVLPGIRDKQPSLAVDLS